MKKVIIASTNPVKIEAVKKGFEKMFEGETFEFSGVSVESGVPDQPMSQDETFTGAKNRAVNAKSSEPTADFWVGIEGGIEKWGNGEMLTNAWIVVVGKNGQIGKARTESFFLAPRVVELINQGMELGHADDEVFGMSNSKHHLGAAGILTNGIIDRVKLYVDAVIFACVPFVKEEFFPIKN